MTVVKLDAGGLFVYAPVAPTAECLRLLSEVEAAHGAVAARLRGGAGCAVLHSHDIQEPG